MLVCLVFGMLGLLFVILSMGVVLLMCVDMLMCVFLFV